MNIFGLEEPMPPVPTDPAGGLQRAGVRISRRRIASGARRATSMSSLSEGFVVAGRGAITTARPEADRAHRRTRWTGRLGGALGLGQFMSTSKRERERITAPTLPSGGTG